MLCDIATKKTAAAARSCRPCGQQVSSWALGAPWGPPGGPLGAPGALPGGASWGPPEGFPFARDFPL